jgi:hypothetical protein
MLWFEKRRKELKGKESMFYVRGRPVDPKKLQRFTQRKGGLEISIDVTEDSGSCKEIKRLSVFIAIDPFIVPEDIICTTPTTETPSAPDAELDTCDVMLVDEPPSVGKFSTLELAKSSVSPVKADHSPNAFSWDEGPPDEILLDHAYLNNFWGKWWPSNNPNNEILSFHFTNDPRRDSRIEVDGREESNNQRRMLYPHSGNFQAADEISPFNPRNSAGHGKPENIIPAQNPTRVLLSSKTSRPGVVNLGSHQTQVNMANEAFAEE